MNPWLIGLAFVGVLCLLYGWIVMIVRRNHAQMMAEVERKNRQLIREQFPASDYESMYENLLSHAEEEAAKLRA